MDASGAMAGPSRVTIVAEAAQGFEGDLRLARLLVRAAATGSADVVKFQLVFADELATPDYPYYALFKQLEMPDEAWVAVVDEAQAHGLGVAFDVFGLRSLALAVRLGAVAVKLHASDFFNDPLVDEALARAPDVWFSAGGITADEVADFLHRVGARAAKLTLMYGFQAEPTPTDGNHLARLGALRARFPALRVGFMDHAPGSSDAAGWLALLALPFGVSVIEKHVTLARGIKMEDDVSALEPREFAALVTRVRSAEDALGNSALALTAAEQAYRQRAVKVVVTRQPLPAGHRIQASDIALLRAKVESGQPTIERVGGVIDKTLARAVAAGRALEKDDLM